MGHQWEGSEEDPEIPQWPGGRPSASTGAGNSSRAAWRGRVRPDCAGGRLPKVACHAGSLRRCQIKGDEDELFSRFRSLRNPVNELRTRLTSRHSSAGRRHPSVGALENHALRRIALKLFQIADELLLRLLPLHRLGEENGHGLLLDRLDLELLLLLGDRLDRLQQSSLGRAFGRSGLA